MSKEEELGVGKSGRRIDLREEYYVSSHLPFFPFSVSLSGDHPIGREGNSPGGWLVRRHTGLLYLLADTVFFPPLVASRG